MAKRFTDTNKYKKPFIRGLQGAYKLLWDYLYHECDHAGIWIVDFEIAQIHLGHDSKINKEDAIKFFNDGEIRVFEIDKNRWFLPGFIEFQYGELNPENRAHNSVIKILKSYNLIDSDFKIKPLVSPSQGAKDKDKDKEKDMDKDKEENLQKNLIQKTKDLESEFEKFRKAYPGTKGGFEKEFKNFQKQKDWKTEILKLWIALQKEIDWRASRPADKFTPEWKHLKTWINSRCWEQELESVQVIPVKSKTKIQDENIAKGLESFLNKQKLQDADIPKLEAGAVHG